MSKTVLRILSFVFILVWSLAFFIGFNYAMSGEYFISIIVTAIILITMGAVFYYMLRLNEAPVAALGVKGSQTLKWVLIAIYAALSLFMAVYINHMGVVSLSDKKSVQHEAKEQIKELRTTFDYNPDEENPAPNSYYAWVKDQLAIYRDQLKSSRSTSIDVMLADMEDKLMIESGFDKLHNNAIPRLNQIEKAVDSWNIFTVVTEINSLQHDKKNWEERVESCSQIVEALGDDPFICTSEHNSQNLLEHVVNVSKQPSLLAIFIMLIIQFFILLSYFASLPKNNSVDGFNLAKAERKGRIRKGDISVWNPEDNND